MSKILQEAYVKPDVAVTLQVEMHPPTAGWGVTHIKPMSQIAHGACIKPMSNILHGACMKPGVAVTLQVEMHPQQQAGLSSTSSPCQR